MFPEYTVSTWTRSNSASASFWLNFLSRHKSINMSISTEATEPFLQEQKYTDSETSEYWKAAPAQSGRDVRRAVWLFFWGTLILVFSNVTTYYLARRSIVTNLDTICASHTSEWCKLFYPLETTLRNYPSLTLTSTNPSRRGYQIWNGVF